MRWTTLFILVVAAGCATTQTHAPQPDTPTGSPTEMPASTPSQPAQASREFVPPTGYRLTRIENGERIYCRKMVLLGSRFPKQLCGTEQQLKELAAINEGIRRDKDERSRICVGECGAT